MSTGQLHADSITMTSIVSFLVASRLPGRGFLCQYPSITRNGRNTSEVFLPVLPSDQSIFHSFLSETHFFSFLEWSLSFTFRCKCMLFFCAKFLSRNRPYRAWPRNLAHQSSPRPVLQLIVTLPKQKAPQKSRKECQKRIMDARGFEPRTFHRHNPSIEVIDAKRKSYP